MQIEELKHRRGQRRNHNRTYNSKIGRSCTSDIFFLLEKLYSLAQKTKSYVDLSRQPPLGAING